jgi:hypothetical protein
MSICACFVIEREGKAVWEYLAGRERTAVPKDLMFCEVEDARRENTFC